MSLSTVPTTIANARLLTLAPHGAPPGPRRGRWMRDLGIIERGWLTIADGTIVGFGAGDPPSRNVTIDARGRVLMPGFVDCHTHACWAGLRYDEADQRLAGVPYLDILRAGGGIMSTVRATRTATEAELVTNTLTRSRAAALLGTTTLEIKTGYGLTPDAELKMLRAILSVQTMTRQRIVPTFLGAHAKDPERSNFVDETIDVTLEHAATMVPGIVADAYCEESAWSLDECRRYFSRAKELGCGIRVHADQFNSLGMVGAAIELGARSVDHLEATTSVDLARLAASTTIGVALPGCGFHLDGRYAPLRALIDANGAAAIATNLNPGSSPTASIPFVLALAVRSMKVLPAEAIISATVNAAHVLGLGHESGAIVAGARADLQLLAARDERSLVYEYAHPGPDEVWIAGEPVHELRRVG